MDHTVTWHQQNQKNVHANRRRGPLLLMNGRKYSHTISFIFAMTLIKQEDHLTAGACVACELRGSNARKLCISNHKGHIARNVILAQFRLYNSRK